MYDRVDSFTVQASLHRLSITLLWNAGSTFPLQRIIPSPKWRELNWMIFQNNFNGTPYPGGVLPYITYTGMCRPTGSWFWSSWFRTGYPFQRRFLERGIIFRMHESSSFVSSHLKLFKDKLLVKTLLNASTSKLLYPSCTLCFSVQGGRILTRAYFYNGVSVLRRILERGLKNWPIFRTGYQFYGKLF